MVDGGKTIPNYNTDPDVADVFVTKSYRFRYCSWDIEI